MTLARLLETGSGAMEARLVFEGLGIELVSCPDMERTTGAGRERVYCFDLFNPAGSLGLVIDESVNIPEAVLEAPGTSIRLNERNDQILAQTFSWRPDQEWWIAQNIDVTDTTVDLFGSADGLADGSVVYVGTETMLVTGVSGTTLTVERGHWQTIPQKHWSGEGGIPQRTMHNRPLRVRGRRVYLYLYGDADDLQGDGTQVWIGHASSDATFDDAGTVCRIQLASIAERLKGKLGGELDVPLVPRGIYYPWNAPLRISIGENGAGVFPPAGAGVADFTGFYETQEEFCDALTDWLAGFKIALNSITTIASTYTAIPTADGRWTVQVVVGAAVTEVTVHVQSSQDGETASDSTYMQTTPGGGESVVGLTAGQLIYPLWTPRNADDRLVPRGHFDAWNDGPTPPARDPSVRTTWPSSRVYLDRSVSNDWSALIVGWPDSAFAHRITALDTTANYVEVNRRNGSTTFLDYRYGAWSLPNFHPTRAIGRGTLETLRAGLVTNGAEYCNRAGMPFLSDADLASWADVIAEAARGRDWLLSRDYVLMQSVDLEDLLQHEMRLYGVFPIIDSTGKIGVQSLERVTSGGEATDITVDDELITVGWSSQQRAGQTVNIVTLKTGYDPAEDEWMGREIVSQDMASYAQDHEDRPLEIEPRSTAVVGDEFIPPEDAADIMRRVSDVFGYPYDFVAVNVPWTHFHLRLGDPVNFSCDHLPDYRTGRRPTTEARAIVVGRKWALGDAHGTLKLLVHGLSVSGYAPTARVLSQLDSGGDLWKLTVDNALYAPADATVASFFAVGFKVRVVEFGKQSPTIVSGTVEAVGDDDITVQFDSTWTPGSATWELCFQSYDAVTDDQKSYAFIASSGLLGTSSGRVYAP